MANVMELRRRIIMNEPHKDTLAGSNPAFESDMAAVFKNLTLTIGPVQSGSGDPSSANPRAIIGFDGVDVYVSNINTWDEITEIGDIDTSTGANADSDVKLRTKNHIPVYPGTKYYSKAPVTMDRFEYAMDKSFLRHVADTAATKEWTVSSDCYYVRFCLNSSYGIAYKQDVLLNYPDTEHDYHYHEGKSASISWLTEAGTIYGGSLAVHDDGTATLTVYPYYSSYNGETLTGPWVSSKDVYAAGATPTTGAQVVDLGGISNTYTLTGIAKLKSHKGDNKILCEPGAVSAIYWKHV